MKNALKIWKVLYKFEVPGEHPVDYATEKYIIAARNEQEARTKADDYFLNTRAWMDIQKHYPDLAEKGYECNIKEHKKYISKPKLTMDAEKLAIDVKLSKDDDGIYVEFRAHEKDYSEATK